MAKQVISVGLAVNDGTGDTLRTGAQKINENFTELYTFLGNPSTGQLSVVSTVKAGAGVTINNPSGNVTISSRIATRDAIGAVKADGLTINVAEDGTISASGIVSRLATSKVTLSLEDDGDVTSRLKASGPLIILAGGDGAENANSNYTQLQWTNDVANPDASKSNYVWLDSNGINFSTMDLVGTGEVPAYSNTLSYNHTGTLKFNDLGVVGPVQSANGIDLYANSGMDWAQLNYNNRNFFWVSSNSANVDVMSADTLTNYSWEFSQAGELTTPGAVHVNSGNVVFADPANGIVFGDGSSIKSVSDIQIPSGLEVNSIETRNLFLDLWNPISQYGAGKTVQVQAYDVTATLSMGAVGQVLKFMGTGQTMSDAKKIIIAPDAANGWQMTLGGITEHQSGFIPPAPTYISESYITHMYGTTLEASTVRATSVFRPPVLTTTARDALTSTDGDMIYNSTTGTFQGYQQGAWVDLAPPAVDGGYAING